MEKWERDYQKMVANIETVKEAVGPKSMVQAINKMATKARGVAARKVSAEKKVPLFVVRRRMFVRNASLKRILSTNRAYIRDVPLISVGENARTGKQTGTFKHRQKGDVGPGYGGTKIRKHYAADAFVNVIRRNQVVHVMRRKQRATWDGKKRLPVEVLKIKLDASFDKHFRKSFVDVVNARYDIEFNAAFKSNIIKILKK